MSSYYSMPNHQAEHIARFTNSGKLFFPNRVPENKTHQKHLNSFNQTNVIFPKDQLQVPNGLPSALYEKLHSLAKFNAEMPNHIVDSKQACATPKPSYGQAQEGIMFNQYNDHIKHNLCPHQTLMRANTQSFLGTDKHKLNNVPKRYQLSNRSKCFVPGEGRSELEDKNHKIHQKMTKDYKNSDPIQEKNFGVFRQKINISNGGVINMSHHIKKNLQEMIKPKNSKHNRAAANKPWERKIQSK